MKTLKIKYIWIILVLSITLNLLVFSLDTIPFIWPKIESKLFKEIPIAKDSDAKMTIVNQSLNMMNSKSNNVWSDPKGFTETIFGIFSKKPNKEFKVYNYHQAYLYYGLSVYLVKNKDSINLKKVKLSFDKVLNYEGKPNFKLDKVDQIPFGLTALTLYQVYGDVKYLNFCDILFEEIKTFRNKEGLILYREHGQVQLNDVLGMIVPFLIEYGKFVKKSDAQLIAKEQVEFFVKYGIDKETYLPSHGIDLRSYIKVGPTNWGRGIGWYLLGLSHYYKATGEFKKEFDGILNTLQKLRTNDGLWSQFPGSSSLFDASTTTMVLYSMNINNKLSNRKVFIDNLYEYVSQDGYILNTSGDTYGINDYSKTFGKSELSQGFLLLII
jgi:rhamnogalacturonyl hydrolase YesR